MDRLDYGTLWMLGVIGVMVVYGLIAIFVRSKKK